MNIEVNNFLAWPYDDALIYMRDAWARVREDRDRIFIACASHREKIITVGKSGIEPLGFADQNILVRKIERGGGLTAHEPGQIVLYPILHIEHHKLSIRDVIHLFEATMIDFLLELGLTGTRHKSGPGIFIGDHKIGFIGIRIKEKIVQHGMAFNLMNDAKIFSQFDPCGVKDLPITSAYRHCELKLSMQQYQERMLYFFLRNFQLISSRANQYKKSSNQYIYERI